VEEDDEDNEGLLKLDEFESNSHMYEDAVSNDSTIIVRDNSQEEEEEGNLSLVSREVNVSADIFARTKCVLSPIGDGSSEAEEEGEGGGVFLDIRSSLNRAEVALEKLSDEYQYESSDVLGDLKTSCIGSKRNYFESTRRVRSRVDVLGDSFEKLLIEAEQGQVFAMFNLGVAYRLGRGVAQSDEKSEYWHAKAVEAAPAHAINSNSSAYFSSAALIQQEYYTSTPQKKKIPPIESSEGGGGGLSTPTSSRSNHLLSTPCTPGPTPTGLIRNPWSAIDFDISLSIDDRFNDLVVRESPKVNDGLV
jgi:hypothetical protein